MALSEDEAVQPSLPPFSGKDGACPKCASRCAETKWLVRPAGTLDQNIPRSEQAKRDWDWYASYWFGGDLLTALSRGRRDVRPDPQPWWPQEWLGRHCLICKHRWDEALATTETTKDST